MLTVCQALDKYRAMSSAAEEMENLQRVTTTCPLMEKKQNTLMGINLGCFCLKNTHSHAHRRAHTHRRGYTQGISKKTVPQIAEKIKFNRKLK